MRTLSIVVPCYNEEEVFPETVKRLTELLDGLEREGRIAADSAVWFVDDGSRDATWALIERESKVSSRIKGLKLSRNRGHQNALLAGLLHAPGDILVSIDADLQDDVNAIRAMLDAHDAGHDVVYGVRRARTTDTFSKRTTALAFYRLMKIMGAESVYNHADFRLMTRRAIEALRSFQEVNLFLRGIIPLIGYPSTTVYYDRASRFAGESKYPLKKMLAFALQGITSFSITPLRMITYLGFTVSAMTLLLTLWVIWVRFASDRAVPGWASTVLPLYFIGGVQILCLGVMGEYLGKIYQEVKGRPRYVLSECTDPKKIVVGDRENMEMPHGQG